MTYYVLKLPEPCLGRPKRLGAVRPALKGALLRRRKDCTTPPHRRSKQPSRLRAVRCEALQPEGRGSGVKGFHLPGTS